MRLSILAVGLAALAGCASAQDSFRTLALGTQSGIHDALQVVITDQPAWQRFWEGHVSNRTDAPPVPAVDFGKERVAALLLGPKSNGCWSVEVTRVSSDNVAESTVVAYTVHEPPKGQVCTAVVTYPHHVIAIAKGPTEVRFERQ